MRRRTTWSYVGGGVPPDPDVQKANIDRQFLTLDEYQELGLTSLR